MHRFIVAILLLAAPPGGLCLNRGVVRSPQPYPPRQTRRRHRLGLQ